MLWITGLDTWGVVALNRATCRTGDEEKGDEETGWQREELHSGESRSEQISTRLGKLVTGAFASSGPERVEPAKKMLIKLQRKLRKEFQLLIYNISLGSRFPQQPQIP